MKKMSRITWFLCLWLGVYSSVQAQQQNWLSAKGNQVIDSRGQEVRLTGVNWFGFETEVAFPHGIWTRDTKSVLKQIKDLGFNSIRIPWANEIMFGNQQISIKSFGEDPVSGVAPMNEEEANVSTPLELMDIIVKWCQENDMKIVLDNHTRKPDSHLQEGLWYTPEFSEEEWIADWVKLATRYKDYSAVAMMDINNEPFGGTWGDSNPATDWNKAAERCGNAILKANPNVMIMVEGVSQAEGSSYWWGGNLKGVKNYPVQLSDKSKLIYSAHEYGPEVSPQDWFESSDFPSNLPALWDEHFDYIYKDNLGPILIGEFGIRDEDNTVALTWFKDLMQFMGSRYSWTFWCMNPNSGDTGGLLKNDWSSINQWKYELLRPYQAAFIPNVIGGTPNPPTPIVTVNGGEVSTSDNETEIVTITGDGEADLITFVTTSTATEEYSYIITDENGRILVVESESHDFEGVAPGICKVYGISYTGTLSVRGKNIKDQELATGEYEVSNNAIIVSRQTAPTTPEPIEVDGGMITGGPFEFTVGDSIADTATGITITGSKGPNSQWVVTDEDANILGLPANIEDVDFDGAGEGVCLIWYMRYAGELEGAAVGSNANDIEGNFDLSNSIRVVRTLEVVTPPTPAEVVGGTLSGGPFTFTVGDGIADNVSEVTVTGSVGENSQWVITNEQGKILGLPANIEDVNFESAGPGVCFIWYLVYNGEIEGLAVENEVSDIAGDFAFAEPQIQVTRTEQTLSINGGTVSGGPFNFIVGDSIPDFVTGVSLSEATGENNAWIVTDSGGTILGMPEDPNQVDFDGQGGGLCLIANVSYNGEIEGLEVGGNAEEGLSGAFAISNYVEVRRSVVTTPEPPTTGSCTFGAPSNEPFPTTYGYFENVFVLGENGPNLSNVNGFAFSYNADQGQIYNMAIQTTDGKPSYYISLQGKIENNLRQASPSISFTGSGITGFDGKYYTVRDGENVALVSTDGGFTIYLSNSSTAPTCSDTGAKAVVDSGFMVYPNPVSSDAVTVTLQGTDLNGSVVSLVNIAGQVIKTSIISTSSSSFNFEMNNVSAGIYMLKLSTKNGTNNRVEKLIIQ